MTRLIRPSIAVAATTAAAIAALWFWALVPFLTGGSFLGPNDASIVHRYFPIHVVPPEWVHSKGILLMDWMLVETRVRLLIVGLFWLVILAAIVHTHQKRLRIKQT
jgi:hypothetical protein